MIAYLLTAALSCDPALAALFTPPRPSVGRYEVCTTAEPLDRTVSELDDHRYGPIEALDPLEAFGTAGQYSHAKLTRLYAGRRVRLIRGWLQRGDRFESITLLSPYPDAGLARLIEGTMVIRFILVEP
jgi:hypothetical protein